MKRIMIEQIIRKLLLEQPDVEPTAAVPKTTTQVITVIIKTGLRTADIAEARDAGAVAGFQLKAIAKRRDGKLASKQSVEKAIAQRINQNQTLQRFLNGNYMFIRSVDQRDSERNYLYNYWILPKEYFSNIMWVYRSYVTKGIYGDYNIAVGLPSGGIDANSAELAMGMLNTAQPLNGPTPHLTVDSIINKINLKPVQAVIDLSFVDVNRYKKAYEWLVQLKQINTKIDTTTLKTPETLEKLPDITTVTEDDAFPVQLLQSNIWSRDLAKTIYFYGNFDTKKTIPVAGKLKDLPTAAVLYDGSFTPTDSRITFKSISGKGYFAINQIDLNNGTAYNLPIELDIKTGKRPGEQNPPQQLFSGTIVNGKLSKGKLQYKPSTEKVVTSDYFQGYFKDNKPFNGIIWDYNNNPKNKYVNGILVDYKSYDGPVYKDSDINVIRSLQVDMIEMFKTNSEILEPLNTEYPIEKFINQSPYGVWDANMQQLIELINVLVTKNTNLTEIDRDMITQDTHQWIIKHKEQKIQ